MRRRPLAALVAVALLGALLLPATSRAGEAVGDLEFPLDEHAHGDGLDYWWGALDIVTTSGHHYTASFAYTSFWGLVVPGHQLWVHQGPYQGRTILTAGGPGEWGHPEAVPGSTVSTATVGVPGVDRRLRLETRSTGDLRVVDAFERTRLDEAAYRLRIDQHAAEVHPTGERIRWGLDAAIEMRDGPPLLAGGTGTWWYGIPETFGYPSRSFQYMQAAQRVEGTLELEQPDGTVAVETIDPQRSGFVMVHEYDATPEDIPAGLLAAQATQMHPRYAQHYQGGMPWELLFVDLGNGAQLMVIVMAFHFTEEGTLGRLGVGPDHPTYRVLATLRLPTGESVALDDDLRVEHLAYREIVGRVPTAFVSMHGHWLQAWGFRLGHPGGTATAGDGSTVEIPAFDLGVDPMIRADQPVLDDDGNGLTQRVPLAARGSYDGCPVAGFGWSELIINWHGRTEHDPWFTGGERPAVPASCGPATTGAAAGNGRPLTPELPEAPPPSLDHDGCQATGAMQPECSYTARTVGGVSGHAAEPGGWTVTITRPGRADPVVVRGFSGFTMYACGMVKPGDRVEVRAGDGSSAFAGNPLLCG